MKTKLLLATALLAAMAAIGIAQGQEHEGSGPAHMSMGMMGNCPIKVQGLEVATADTSDGIALTLTTKTGDVTDLRRRTEALAKMHSASSNKPMMPFTAKYEEAPNGALVTLTPNDPGKLEEFRTKVREHTTMMKSGNCSMMQELMMKGMMNDGIKQTEPPREPESNDHSTHHPQ